MRQVWIGVGILGLLLLGGIWIGEAQADAHGQQIRDLSHAADAAMEDNWTRAEAYLSRGKKEWEEKRGRSAVIYRQDTLEEIDGLFAQLGAQLACRNREGFCANCALLAKYLENLPQSHSFHWQNLL